MAVNNPTDVNPLVRAMNEFRDVVDSRAASIEARLGTDNRGAWSAVGAAVMTVAAGAAVTTWLAAAPVRSGVSSWPAYMFAVVALAGAYLLVAPLIRCWPFTAPSSIPGLLDECIRAGRDARERITYEQLKPLEEAREVAQWTLRTGEPAARALSGDSRPIPTRVRRRGLVLGSGAADPDSQREALGDRRSTHGHFALRLRPGVA